MTRPLGAVRGGGLLLLQVEQLRTLITKVNQWIEKLQSTCPTRLSKRRGRAKATVSSTTNPRTTHSLPRAGRRGPGG